MDGETGVFLLFRNKMNTAVMLMLDDILHN